MKNTKGIILNGEWLGNNVIVNEMFSVIFAISPIVMQEFLRVINGIEELEDAVRINNFNYNNKNVIDIEFSNDQLSGLASLLFKTQNGEHELINCFLKVDRENDKTEQVIVPETPKIRTLQKKPKKEKASVQAEEMYAADTELTEKSDLPEIYDEAEYAENTYDAEEEVSDIKERYTEEEYEEPESFIDAEEEYDEPYEINDEEYYDEEPDDTEDVEEEFDDEEYGEEEYNDIDDIEEEYDEEYDDGYDEEDDEEDFDGDDEPEDVADEDGLERPAKKSRRISESRRTSAERKPKRSNKKELKQKNRIESVKNVDSEENEQSDSDEPEYIFDEETQKYIRKESGNKPEEDIDEKSEEDFEEDSDEDFDEDSGEVAADADAENKQLRSKKLKKETARPKNNVSKRPLKEKGVQDADDYESESEDDENDNKPQLRKRAKEELQRSEKSVPAGNQVSRTQKNGKNTLAAKSGDNGGCPLASIASCFNNIYEATNVLINKIRTMSKNQESAPVVMQGQGVTVQQIAGQAAPMAAYGGDGGPGVPGGGGFAGGGGYGGGYAPQGGYGGGYGGPGGGYAQGGGYGGPGGGMPYPQDAQMGPQSQMPGAAPGQSGGQEPKQRVVPNIRNVEDVQKIIEQTGVSLSAQEQMAMMAEMNMLKGNLNSMRRLLSEQELAKLEEQQAKSMLNNFIATQRQKAESKADKYGNNFRIVGSNKSFNADVVDSSVFIAGDKIYKWGEKRHLQS